MNLFAWMKRIGAWRWSVLLGLGLIAAGYAYWTTTRPAELIRPSSQQSIDAQSSDSAQQPIRQLTPGTSWQLQLSGTVDPTILDGILNPKKMIDLDLIETPQATIDAIRAKNIVVICYFNAGGSENFRSDYDRFPASVQGKGLDMWPGEFWLDVRQVEVLRPIMQSRMDLAVEKKCDGVDPDNVDGYTNDTGFPLAAADQLAYNKMLANEAHARGLSIGLKNDIDQIPELSHDFDWALNEQCFEFNECEIYSHFTSKNKAVFGVEYEGDIKDFCPKANAANLDWLKKELALDARPRTACRLD
ncbi:MAG: endo alpha-1,4 polygalactosaminidase [Patescibacteria group bacterium]